jgi:metal-dependent amidase/aminoacylase/carboxypeptidase family protein
MAILAGLGDWCSENQLNQTDIHLLFQPSEENGRGARMILDDPDFKLNPDYVFAIHNIPGFEKNRILLKENHFSASVVSLVIDLKGKTSHAAEPDKGINPALAIAEIINVLNKFNQANPSEEDFLIITPIFVRMGEMSFGTSAGDAQLGFTIRCWDNEFMKETQRLIRNILQEIAHLNKLELTHRWTEEFYANYNNPEAIRIVRRSAESLNYPTETLDFPFKWGEDFGLFTSRFRGAMIGIGAGRDIPALHNPDFDFPDELIETGVNLFKEIIRSIDTA